MVFSLPEKHLVSILIPILIFLARTADVSMSAVRIIFISRGIRTLAAAIGFFEMLVWLVGVSQIMQNLNDPISYIAFAGGFSMGTFVGVTIEKKIAIGNLAVHFITNKNPESIVRYFRAKGFGVTTIDGQGTEGPVKIVFVIARRKLLDQVLNIVKNFDQNAFYTIEDVREVAKFNPLI